MAAEAFISKLWVFYKWSTSCTEHALLPFLPPPFPLSMKPAEIPWGDAGALYVVESTGVFLSIEKASVRLTSTRRCQKTFTTTSVSSPWITRVCAFSTGSLAGRSQACGSLCPLPWRPHVCHGCQRGQVRPLQHDHRQVSSVCKLELLFIFNFRLGLHRQMGRIYCFVCYFNSTFNSQDYWLLDFFSFVHDIWVYIYNNNNN